MSIRVRDLVNTAGEAVVNPVVATAREAARDVDLSEFGETGEDGTFSIRESVEYHEASRVAPWDEPVATIGQINEFACETGRSFEDSLYFLTTTPLSAAARAWLTRTPIQ